ncbi:hypothetical protein [Xanthobacter agilis]|uniref:Uncharacterized protein n=2 Tax=Xanthobacter agilis TaxID=47492 RepID=A0ABU0LJJ6_XANAG|nr:hypothetical protein [Xanthobacter agilis]MDQ0507303.1 hypothetical protein [Xanthobacter agilis]
MPYRTRMWQVYRLRGYLVTVIQQWHDPHGQPMVRVATAGEGDRLAAGMAERTFLAAAAFVAEDGVEIVEGAR